MAQTFKFNPLSKKFDIVQDTSLLTLKGTVPTTGDLPLIDNSENDLYVVQAGDRLFTWNKAASSGILSDWIDVGSVTSIDWSIINNKPTATVGNIDDAVTKKHIQNTDTILTTDGSIPLFNAGILKRNLLVDDTFNIQIDEIRARDIDGLKLFDDGGNGITIQDGGNVILNKNLTVATNLIFTDQNNGTVTIGNSVTGTDRFNVFGAGVGLQQGIMTLYNSSGGNAIKFRFRDEWTAMSIPPRLEAESSLGLAFNTTTDSQYIWYVNGTANEKMRLNSTGLGLGTTNPLAKLHLSSTGFTTIRIEGFGASRARIELHNTFDSSEDWRIQAGIQGISDDFLSFKTISNDTDRLIITNTGNVGIGTTTPDAKLDIEETVAGTTASLRIHHAEGTNGASHAQLELRTETAFSGDPSILFTVGGQGNWIMGTDNGDTDAFKISKSTVLATLTRLKIDHLGNVEFLSTGGAIIPNRVTTTQRDAFVTTANGMIIYNTTLNKFQGRENGAWANLI